MQAGNKAISFQSRSCALLLKPTVSKDATFTLNGLCCWFTSHSLQFSSCQMFGEKLSPSMQPTDDCDNFIATNTYCNEVFAAALYTSLYAVSPSDSKKPATIYHELQSGLWEYMTVLGTDWAVTASIFSSHSQMLRENLSHRDTRLPGPDEKWSLGLGDWGQICCRVYVSI